MVKGDLEGDSKGDLSVDFKQEMEGDLLSISGQVRSWLGLVQVWFSLQPKFNSLELDSEVGRLIFFGFDWAEIVQKCHIGIMLRIIFHVA